MFYSYLYNSLGKAQDLMRYGNKTLQFRYDKECLYFWKIWMSVLVRIVFEINRALFSNLGYEKTNIQNINGKKKCLF